MSASRIAAVASLAHQLFSASSATGAVTKDGLLRLTQLLAGVTAKDVDFDSRLITDASRVHSPVLYVHIVENGVLSMGIFVLRPRARIPLHDHPGMHGLCKLLHGRLRCRAYSPAPKLAAAAAAAAGLLPVRLTADAVIGSASPPLLLTPTEGGYHELQALDEGAAFLDILAPPYDHDTGRRVCRYYKVVSLLQQPVDARDREDSKQQQQQQQQHLDYLLEIPQPRDFVCSSIDYTGPKVA